MAYSLDIKLAVIEKRKKGYSLNELHNEFGITKSTLSYWLSNIPLEKFAKERLLTKITKGQLASAETKTRNTKEKEHRFFIDASLKLNDLSMTKEHARFICAMLYCCEGTKNPTRGVCFTNSDPGLMRTFLNLFRKGFILDENKFHPRIHLHEYHSPSKQLDFWSKVTHIDKRQFRNPYMKPHTGKNTRPGYPGCLALVYYDSLLARELHSIAKAFTEKFN